MTCTSVPGYEESSGMFSYLQHILCTPSHTLQPFKTQIYDLGDVSSLTCCWHSMLGTTMLWHPSKEMTHPPSIALPGCTHFALASIRSFHVFAQLQTLRHGWKGKAGSLAILIYPCSAHSFVPSPSEPQALPSGQHGPAAPPSTLSHSSPPVLAQLSARNNTHPSPSLAVGLSSWSCPHCLQSCPTEPVLGKTSSICKLWCLPSPTEQVCQECRCRDPFTARGEAHRSAAHIKRAT